jgi:hypothetical protein
MRLGPDLEVVLLGDSFPGVPVGRAAEFWGSSRAAGELRPGQRRLGNGREEARLPTYWMRQLEPGRSDCASFGVAFGWQ